MSNETPKDPVAHEQRRNHIAMLMERVLQVGRWPHYQLLLDDLMELACMWNVNDVNGEAREIKCYRKILSLERTLLYGGKSLFAPIFYGHDYRIREASPETAYERGPYNEGMLDNRFMAYGKPSSYAGKGDFDLVLIPNALHHMPLYCEGYGWHVSRFAACLGDLRPGGYLYIFEQFIEEIHQKPDDYVRYTPDGLASLLEAAGYRIEYVRQTGNIFTCTQFLLDNILEYIEGGTAQVASEALDYAMAKGEDIRRIQGMIKTLQKMAPNYPHNGLRQHTECPKAFSVLARKPA